MENGYVVVKSAFPKEIAEQICKYAWSELGENHVFQWVTARLAVPIPTGTFAQMGRTCISILPRMQKEH
ncbi:MAG: hypothetical protein F4Z66_07310 [Gammaproteobacteria bacterium]|nr:hypothetical protein [Gammaproteobacteria bacterium]